MSPVQPVRPALLLLLAVCLVTVWPPSTTAVDPEYEFAPRIQQVFDAIVNRYVLRRQTVPVPASSTRPANAMATPTTTAVETAIFRCRRAIDAKFVVVAAGHSRRRIARTLDLSAPLAILIHGWFDTFDRGWFNRTATGYQRHVGGNFCTLDWGALSQDKYGDASAGTRVVAERLTQFLRHVATMGIAAERVTLIGHSFGAQIAGLSGAQLGGRLGRIFGLDPAGWLFTKPRLVGEAGRLTRGDAMYVQCMHTNRDVWGLGSGVPCGDQDFYPNDGLSPQPGCLRPLEEGSIVPLLLTCSHYKSVQYFIASLDPANRFKAWSCADGYAGWLSGRCAGNAFDYMGVHSRNRVHGKLYLRTVKEAPFVSTD